MLHHFCSLPFTPKIECIFDVKPIKIFNKILYFHPDLSVLSSDVSSFPRRSEMVGSELYDPVASSFLPVLVNRVPQSL